MLCKIYNFLLLKQQLMSIKYIDINDLRGMCSFKKHMLIFSFVNKLDKGGSQHE